MTLRPLLAALAATALAACATDGESAIAWAPRTDANLSADKAECTRTANDLDINSPKEYTDGRYGVAAAMASRIDHDSLKAGAVDRMRDAVFQDCMTRKGWAPK